MANHSIDSRAGDLKSDRNRGKVTIYELELLDWQPPERRRSDCRVLFSRDVMSGAPARDLGRLSGRRVATLASLVRTKVGQFTIEDATASARSNATSLCPTGCVPIDVALAPRCRVNHRLPYSGAASAPGQGCGGREVPTDGTCGWWLRARSDRGPQVLAVVVSKWCEVCRTQRIILCRLNLVPRPARRRHGLVRRRPPPGTSRLSAARRKSRPVLMA